MRLQNATPAELQAAGIDVQGMGSPRKDISTFLSSVAGVQNLTKNGKSFRDPYTVLGEIAKKWNTYSGVQQSAIAEQLAGKNNVNGFLSLVQNWGAVEKSYATAQKAQGSADRELANASDSVSFKVKQVKASFEDLSTSFMTSGLLKTGAGSLNTLVQGADKLVKTLGAGGSIATFLTGRDLLKSALTGQGVASMITRAALGDAYDENDQLGNIQGLGKWTKDIFSGFGTGLVKRFRSRGASDVANKVADQAQKLGYDVTNEAMGAIAKDAMTRARQSGLKGDAAKKFTENETLNAAAQGQKAQGSNPYKLLNGNEISVNASGQAVGAATGALSTMQKVLGWAGIAVTAASVGYTVFKQIDKAKGITKKQSTKNMNSAWDSYDKASANLTDTQQKIQDNATQQKELVDKENKTLDDKAKLEKLQTQQQSLRLRERTQQAQKSQKEQEASDKTIHAYEKNYGGLTGVTHQDVQAQLQARKNGVKVRNQMMQTPASNREGDYNGTNWWAANFAAKATVKAQTKNNNPLTDQIADYVEANDRYNKAIANKADQNELNLAEKARNKAQKVLTKQSDALLDYYDNLSNKDYSKMTGQEKQLRESIMQSLDSIQYATLGPDEYKNWKQGNVLDDFMTKNADSINKMLKASNSGYTVGDFADNYMNLLAKFGEMEQNGKFSVNGLTGPLAKLAKTFKDAGLSASDLQNSVNDIIKADKSYANSVETGKEQATSNHDVVKAQSQQYEQQYKSIQEASKAAFQSQGMTYDQATTLETMGFGKALERTASGINLNYQAYQKLNKEMRQSQMGDVVSQIDDAYDTYNKVGDKINEIQTKMANGTATKAEIKSLSGLNQNYAILAQNIENLKNQEAELEGSDSAVNQFLQALQMPQAQDTLDNVGKGLSQAQKDIKAGKTSSNAVRAMEQMFTNEDISGWSNSKVAENANNFLNKSSMFGSFNKSGTFTVDAQKGIGLLEKYQEHVRKSGNDTYTFFDKAGKNINGTTEDIMNMSNFLGVDQSLVQQIVDTLGEYGYNVNIDDSRLKTIGQRLHDADQEIQNINKDGAKSKYMNGGEVLTSENLDRVYKAGQTATKKGDQTAYNQSAESLNANIDRINAARHAATDAHDSTALNAYNDALVQTLQTREKLDSYKNNPIMQLDASKFKGDAGTVVSSMQELQEKQDTLDTATQAATQGIQVNVQAAQGEVTSALDGVQTAIQAAFDSGTDSNLIQGLHELGITGGAELRDQIQKALINSDGSLNLGNWEKLKIKLQPEVERGKSNTEPTDKGLAGPETTENQSNVEKAQAWDRQEKERYTNEQSAKSASDGLNNVAGASSAAAEALYGLAGKNPDGSDKGKNDSGKDKDKGGKNNNDEYTPSRKTDQQKLSNTQTTHHQMLEQENEHERTVLNPNREDAYTSNLTKLSDAQARHHEQLEAENQKENEIRQKHNADLERENQTGIQIEQSSNSAKRLQQDTENQMAQNAAKNNQALRQTTPQNSLATSGLLSTLGTIFNPVNALNTLKQVVSNPFGVIDAYGSDTGATVNSTRNWQRYSPVGGPSMPSYMMTEADRQNYIANNTRPLTGQGSTTQLTTAVKDNTAATKEGTQTTRQTTIEKTVQGVQQGLTGTGTAPTSLGLRPQGWAAFAPNAVQTTSNPFLNGSFTGGQLGQPTAKVKVEADTSDAQSKVKDVGKNTNAKVKVDADTQQADQKAKDVGKGANPKVKVQGDVSDVTKKISSIKAQPIKVKLAVDPTTGTKTNLPNYGGRFALKNPNQYGGGGGTTVTQKVSGGSSAKQKLTGTVEYKAEFKTKKAPPLTGVAIYISQFPTKKAPPLSGTATYSAVFPTRSAPTLSGVVHYTAVFSGAKPAYKGSAHAGGTASPGGHAYADGTPKKFTVGQDETALVNEVGPELIVRGDQFFIANGGKPGFTGLKSSDIIFNAKQTSQLLTKGYTNTYAHANGTVSGPAFAKGTKKKSGSGDNSENDQDWIEVYLKRIENEISRLDITASSGFKTWNVRMDAYTSEIQKTTQEVGKYSEISQKYLAKANAVGLSDAYKKKVQNGDLSIENIASEDTRKKISTYTQWYEKYLDSLTNEMKLKQQILELEQKRDQVRLDWLDNLTKETDVRLTQLTKYTPYSHQQGRVDQAWIQEYDNRYAEREQALRSQHLEIAARMNQYEVGSDQWRTLERSMQDVDNQSETLLSSKAESLVNAFSTIIQSIEDSLDKIANTARILNTSTGQFDGLDSAMTSITGQAEKLSDTYFKEAQGLTRILNSFPENRKYSPEWYTVYNQQQAALKNARNVYSTVKSQIDDITNTVISNLEAIRQVQSTIKPVVSGTTVTGTGATVSNLDQQLKAYRDQRNTKIDTLNWGIRRGEVIIGDSQYTKVLTENAQNQINAANAVSNAFSDVQSYYSAATSQLQLLNDEVTKYNALTEDGGKSVKSSSIAELYDNAGKTVANLYQQYKDLQDVINTGLSNGTIFVGSTKYNELKQKQNEFRKNLEQTFTEAASNIDTLFSALTEHLSSTNDLIQQYISNATESGHMVGASFYNALISSAQEEIGLKEQEKTALESSLQQGLASGAFWMYSNDWYTLKKKIDDCDKSILQSQGSIIKYNNSLKELEWDAVDKVTDRFDDQIKELSFLAGLIDDSDMWDENNKTTNDYLGRMGLLTSEYDANFKAAQSLDDVIKELQKDLEADPSNDTLHKKLDSFLGKKQNYITAAHSLRKEIVELANSNLSKLQNQLSKLISQYEKLLDAERDQMSYQRSITKAQETVDTLQKQVMSYTGDTSEEGQAKLQKARKELKDAQDDLRDKQDDKRISDIKALLSELQDNFSTAIDNYMKNSEQVLIDQIALVNANQDAVKDDINKTATDNGYKVSSATQALLTPTTETQNMVSAFKGDFDDQSALAVSSLDNIQNTVQSFIDEANTNAQNQLAALESMQNANQAAEEAAEQRGQAQLDATLRAAQAAEAAAAAAGAALQDHAITDQQGHQAELDENTKKNNTWIGRYRNKTSGEHVLIAQNSSEAQNAMNKGYNQEEGTGFYSNNDKDTRVTVTRLYNAKTGEHLYTTSGGEAASLQKNGWTAEPKSTIYGTSDTKNGTPVYRMYNAKTGEHLYTINSYEKDNLIKAGWKYEGIGWYAPKNVGNYATGTKSNKVKGNYWTQEHGKQEAIIRKSDGAILTPLAQGDAVLNGKATQRLYEMANNPQSFFKHTSIATDVPKSNVNNDINVTFNLPNVTNSDEFIRELQTNPKMEKLIQEMTLGQLNGGNTLKKRGIRVV